MHYKEVSILGTEKTPRNPAKIEMRQIFGAFRFMVFEHCSILVLTHFVLAIIDVVDGFALNIDADDFAGVNAFVDEKES